MQVLFSKYENCEDERLEAKKVVTTVLGLLQVSQYFHYLRLRIIRLRSVSGQWSILQTCLSPHKKRGTVDRWSLRVSIRKQAPRGEIFSSTSPPSPTVLVSLVFRIHDTSATLTLLVNFAMLTIRPPSCPVERILGSVSRTSEILIIEPAPSSSQCNSI